jgi:glycosyltransferase involved in cell wall biosynthesis
MSEPTVSALVLARDEAHNLPSCLAALSWADERIVVVDPMSRDATLTIARGLADRVIVRPFDDFASQRNAALAVARGDWAFAVDADERSSPAQAREVRQRIRQAHAPAGFRVPIRSTVLGRPFRFSGTQHDWPLRLFHRTSGRWVGEVHETVRLDGHVERLTVPLEHTTLPDIHTFLAKINAYTTLEATRMTREGRVPQRIDLALRPLWTFAKLYLGKQGFRDGFEGFLFCALSGLSVAVRHCKAREMMSRRDVEKRAVAAGPARGRAA